MSLRSIVACIFAATGILSVVLALVEPIQWLSLIGPLVFGFVLGLLAKKSAFCALTLSLASAVLWSVGILIAPTLAVILFFWFSRILGINQPWGWVCFYGATSISFAIPGALSGLSFGILASLFNKAFRPFVALFKLAWTGGVLGALCGLGIGLFQPDMPGSSQKHLQLLAAKWPLLITVPLWQLGIGLIFFSITKRNQGEAR